jgi:hypothetical protein
MSAKKFPLTFHVKIFGKMFTDGSDASSHELHMPGQITAYSGAVMTTDDWIPARMTAE